MFARFSVIMDDIKMLDDDSISLRSFKSNSINARLINEQDTENIDRRASLINPIPSVNRNSGRIVLTIRNDAR